MSIPAIQHWIVSVARAARLEEAGALDIPSDTPVAAAWQLAAMRSSITDDDLAALVARHYRLAVADLDGANPHARRLIPARVARKLQVIPLQYTDRTLSVATADPVGMDAEREISHIAGRTVQFEVGAPAALAAAVEETYPMDADLRHELPPLSHDARGGPHVLVVDDDADMRLLLKTLLQSGGFRVEEAADGPQALEMLSGNDPYDLVTLDLTMGEMHGLEVLRRMRKGVATVSVPVVVATATDDPEVEMELFEAGADDFIVKPVDPPRFLLRLQAVLRRRAGAFPGRLSR